MLSCLRLKPIKVVPDCVLLTFCASLIVLAVFDGVGSIEMPDSLHSLVNKDTGENILCLLTKVPEKVVIQTEKIRISLPRIKTSNTAGASYKVEELDSLHDLQKEGKRFQALSIRGDVSLTFTADAFDIHQSVLNKQITTAAAPENTVLGLNEYYLQIYYAQLGEEKILDKTCIVVKSVVKGEEIFTSKVKNFPSNTGNAFQFFITKDPFAKGNEAELRALTHQVPSCIRMFFKYEFAVLGWNHVQQVLTKLEWRATQPNTKSSALLYNAEGFLPPQFQFQYHRLVRLNHMEPDYYSKLSGKTSLDKCDPPPYLADQNKGKMFAINIFSSSLKELIHKSFGWVTAYSIIGQEKITFVTSVPLKLLDEVEAQKWILTVSHDTQSVVYDELERFKIQQFYRNRCGVSLVSAYEAKAELYTVEEGGGTTPLEVMGFSVSKILSVTRCKVVFAASELPSSYKEMRIKIVATDGQQPEEHHVVYERDGPTFLNFEEQNARVIYYTSIDPNLDLSPYTPENLYTLQLLQFDKVEWESQAYLPSEPTTNELHFVASNIPKQILVETMLDRPHDFKMIAIKQSTNSVVEVEFVRCAQSHIIVKRLASIHSNKSQTQHKTQGLETANSNEASINSTNCDDNTLNEFSSIDFNNNEPVKEQLQERPIAPTTEVQKPQQAFKNINYKPTPCYIQECDVFGNLVFGSTAMGVGAETEKEKFLPVEVLPRQPGKIFRVLCGNTKDYFRVPVSATNIPEEVDRINYNSAEWMFKPIELKRGQHSIQLFEEGKGKPVFKTSLAVMRKTDGEFQEFVFEHVDSNSVWCNLSVLRAYKLMLYVSEVKWHCVHAFKGPIFLASPNTFSLFRSGTFGEASEKIEKAPSLEFVTEPYFDGTKINYEPRFKFTAPSARFKPEAQKLYVVVAVDMETNFYMTIRYDPDHECFVQGVVDAPKIDGKTSPPSFVHQYDANQFIKSIAVKAGTRLAYENNKPIALKNGNENFETSSIVPPSLGVVKRQNIKK